MARYTAPKYWYERETKYYYSTKDGRKWWKEQWYIEGTYAKKSSTHVHTHTHAHRHMHCTISVHLVMWYWCLHTLIFPFRMRPCLQMCRRDLFPVWQTAKISLSPTPFSVCALVIAWRIFFYFHHTRHWLTFPSMNKSVYHLFCINAYSISYHTHDKNKKKRANDSDEEWVNVRWNFPRWKDCRGVVLNASKA